MSRLAAHLDLDDMEREDVAKIIDDAAVDLNQYRYTDNIDENIFRDDDNSRAPVFLRKVRGRIDRRNKIFMSQNGEVSKSVDHLFIITAYTKDVKTNDIFKFDGIEYVIKFVNKVGQSFSESECEVTT